MVKLLPIAILVLLMTGVFVYRNYLQDLNSQQQQKASTKIVSQEAGGSGDRLGNLEIAVAKLIQKVNNNSSESTSSASQMSESDRIKALERSVNDLKIRVSKIEDDSSVTASGSKAPIYVPLGVVGNVSSVDWLTTDLVEVILNSADYPGVTSFQIEASIKVSQVGAKGHLRLYNFNDSQAIIESELSTSSNDYTWVTSPKFNLSGGTKTYRFQMKTPNGGEVSVSDLRVKINF